MFTDQSGGGGGTFPRQRRCCSWWWRDICNGCSTFLQSSLLSALSLSSSSPVWLASQSDLLGLDEQRNLCLTKWSAYIDDHRNLPHKVSCLDDHRNLFLTGGWLCLQWCRELCGTPWVLKRIQLGMRWQLWTLVVGSNMKAKYILECANSLWRFGCLLQFQCTPSSTFSMWSTQRMWRTGRYHRFFYQICFHSPALLVECSLSCCLYWSWMRDNKNNFQYLWYM